MPTLDTSNDCVTPIKFQQLGEEDHHQPDGGAPEGRRSSGKPSSNNSKLDTSFSSSAPADCAGAAAAAAAIAGHSCPTVTFENICFNTDKSSQQSNFLAECAFRAKQCLGPALGLTIEPREVQILRSVNLNVPHGSIFGLLGPSSCGKTTLLRCLVGLLQPTAGSIRLFGREVGGAGEEVSLVGRLFCLPARSDCDRTTCGVPGPNVGYMPQDLGLYEDFTIREILRMFGRFVRMSGALVETRIEFMRQFLELPDVDRQIQTLSGGQKRRVSFAIACLHMPPLIILDEPTVGVDPLLRQSIWKYLRRLADEENKTIIITTHYIEEAAQADQVAFMRAGEILVQGAPGKIMQIHGSNTLEEAFLKICHNYEASSDTGSPSSSRTRLSSRFTAPGEQENVAQSDHQCQDTNKQQNNQLTSISQLRLQAKEKMELFDNLRGLSLASGDCLARSGQFNRDSNSQLAELPTNKMISRRQQKWSTDGCDVAGVAVAQSDHLNHHHHHHRHYDGKRKQSKLFKRSKFTLNSNSIVAKQQQQKQQHDLHHQHPGPTSQGIAMNGGRGLAECISRNFAILVAVIYKNYRRNFNSVPLLAFQFMLPMLQMVSFSLCVGGRPTGIGLGLVNSDQPISFANSDLLLLNATSGRVDLDSAASDYDATAGSDELLSLRYLSFLDDSMLTVKSYPTLQDALAEVRRGKLWAAMEIGANFSTSIIRRFDPDNFYTLDLDTIHQSAIKIYPDQSNKILHLICYRSIVDSFRKFLAYQFDHFKRLPLEMREPIFHIEPNIISNSIDGYTESIAPGLLASLTYIMAAGLTTFIMVVERSTGLLERTYTTGINPVTYLLAHAIFRSLLMMAQIALVFVLTFCILKQPLVGSLGLAYLMLMTLNLTGITYGLLISSIVTDQNGAALTIVSSLVVKITLSGILWPLEAIPVWLRAICYIQPLTFPVQALKSIILKGSSVGDRTVNLGFLVSLTWLLIFITIAAKRFKFYQH